MENQKVLVVRVGVLVLGLRVLEGVLEGVLVVGLRVLTLSVRVQVSSPRVRVLCPSPSTPSRKFLQKGEDWQR